jgi:energy-converting hydrogenase Eha subunit E
MNFYEQLILIGNIAFGTVSIYIFLKQVINEENSRRTKERDNGNERRQIVS